MNITEPFAIGNSGIHLLDPRPRVVIAVLFSTITAVLQQFPPLFLAFALALFLVFRARLNPVIVGKRLTILGLFLTMIWLLVPLTFEGELVTRFWKLNIYLPGIVYSAKITIKSVTILLIFMSLVATMPITTLGHTLHRLRLPEKLVFLLLITYRYLFVIGEEYVRLRTAMKIRGFKSGTNLHSFKTTAYLIGMLFVRASVRAERVNQAMRLRGFNGHFYSLEDFAAYRSSGWFLTFALSLLILILVLEWLL